MAETPERCPTCDSTDPSIRFTKRLAPTQECDDPFHDEAKAKAGAQSPNPQSVAAQPEGAERRWVNAEQLIQQRDRAEAELERLNELAAQWDRGEVSGADLVNAIRAAQDTGGAEDG